jgi:alpha-ketoglutaric semialdehyde dehydrogenase
MVKEFGHFVNGAWTKPSKGAVIESRSPTDGRLLATFGQGSAKDVDSAVKAALAALGEWRRMPAPRRGEILLRAAQILRERKDALGRTVATEMGKIISEARGDVQEAIDFYEYVAGEGRRLFGMTTPSELPNKLLMTRRDPLGVVGLITPWNFPVAIPAWKSGAALVVGNTFVLKPAEQTPLCAAEFVEALHDAGFPKGVVNMVSGLGEVAGDALVTDRRVRGISFTGGVETGKIVAARCASRLAFCGLELGGKNPMIVDEEADLDLMMEGLMFGAFGTTGQRCTATSRLFVHASVYDEVMQRLVKRVKALKVGDPLDPSTDVGPLNSREQLEKVLSYIEIGSKEGAKLAVGGRRLESGALKKGFFVEPTVFEGTHGMRISKEEIFGPVLTVMKFKDLDAAIDQANDVEYGLSSSIYTRNINKAFRAVDRLEAGLAYINAPTIGAEVQVPFGGIKSTGNGHREAGPTAIEEFTEIKTVIVEYSGRLQKAQIDLDAKPAKGKRP